MNETDFLLLLAPKSAAYNPNAPLALSLTPLVWYDATRITGKSNGDALAAGDILDYSGNGRNAASVANITYSAAAINGLGAIRFNGTTSDVKSPDLTQAQPLSIYLVFKSLSFRNNAHLNDGKTNNVCAILSNPSAGKYGLWGGAGAVQPLIDVAVTVDTTGTVVRARFNTTASDISVGFDAPTGNTAGTNALDGITLGATGLLTANFFMNMDLCEAVFYPGLLTYASEQALETYFKGKYGAAILQASHSLPFVVCVGDSLTYGTGSTGGNSYPAQMETALGGTGVYRTENLGVGSQTMAGINTVAATLFHSIYRPSRAKNIAVIWAGTNDIAGAADGPTTYGRITTGCNAARAAGYKVVVCDVIARNTFGAGENNARSYVNSNVAANYATFADGYAALSADARLQNPADGTYYSDGTHLTNAGYGVVSGIVEPVVAAL